MLNATGLKKQVFCDREYFKQQTNSPVEGGSPMISA